MIWAEGSPPAESSLYPTANLLFVSFTASESHPIWSVVNVVKSANEIDVPETVPLIYLP